MTSSSVNIAFSASWAMALRLIEDTTKSLTEAHKAGKKPKGVAFSFGVVLTSRKERQPGGRCCEEEGEWWQKQEEAQQISCRTAQGHQKQPQVQHEEGDRSV